MKKIIKRITIFLFVAIGVVYLAYQVYLISSNSITTESAVRVTVSDTITGQGVAFRDETVLSLSTSDTIVYRVDAGAKIAKGSVVAEIYQNAQDAVLQQKIDVLESRIELLRSVQNSGGASHLLADAIQEQIVYDITTLKTALNKDVFAVSDITNTLLVDVLKKNMLADDSIDLSAMISQMQSEADSLKGKLSGSVQVVETPLAGYFVSNVDGLEELCSIDKVDGYSADEILSLADRSAAENDVVGKVINSYEWYYAAVIDSDKAKNLSIGSSVSVSFSFTDVNDITAVITDIKSDTDGRSVVIIKSTNMSAPISNIRSQDIVIETNIYTGIRVPVKAIHVIDGVKGVYVLTNNVVSFKELDPVFENESYIISAPGASGSPYLRVYDELIVEGRDLYDGKII